MLFFVAENLEQRIGEFSARLRSLFGGSAAQAINLIMFYAAHAEKYDGAVHATRSRIVTLAMPERWGVMGIVCLDESPLLSMISLVMPAIAMGSRVVAVPSTTSALIATDFYQVIEPSAVLGVICGAALLSD